MLTVELPDTDSTRLFASCDRERRERIVRLGMTMIDHAQECAHKWDDTNWQERVDKLRGSLNTQAEDAAVELQSAVRAARAAERACADAEATRLREDADRWRTALADLQLEAAKAGDAKATRVQEKCDARIDQIRGEYEQRMEQLRQRLEEAQGQQLCSSRKGNRGEAHVLSQLNLLFPQAEIEDTHATPGRGDFVVRDGGLVMMVETKNYTRNVPKAEVDKFFRDLDNAGNEEFQCAVLVSLRSGVCCREDFAFEMHGDRPVLFIHNLERNYDNLMLAAKFFQLVLSASDSVDLKSKAAEDELRTAAATLKRGYATQKTSVNRFCATQLSLIAEQQARIAQLYAALGQKL